MFWSKYKAFVIIVTAYLTFDCANTNDEKDRIFNEQATRCIIKIARYFQISLEDHPITPENYKNNDSIVTKLNCIKNAITHLKITDNGNTVEQRYHKSLRGVMKSDKILNPSKFCSEETSCVNRFCLTILPFVKSECEKDLQSFGNTSMSALHYAFDEVLLSDFEGRHYAALYMQHIIDHVGVNNDEIIKPSRYISEETPSYLALECVCLATSPKFSSEENIVVCLNRIAQYFKFSLFAGYIDLNNYQEESYKLTSLQCAKNAINYMKSPAHRKTVEENYYDLLKTNFYSESPTDFYIVEEYYYNLLKTNLNSDFITDKLTFCGYKKPSCILCSIFDRNDPKAKKCMVELEDFPENAEEALEFAFTSVYFSEYSARQDDATKYLMHMIADVRLKDSIVEPLDYCKKIFENN